MAVMSSDTDPTYCATGGVGGGEGEGGVGGGVGEGEGGGDGAHTSQYPQLSRSLSTHVVIVQHQGLVPPSGLRQ